MEPYYNMQFADGRVWKFITKTFMVYRWNLGDLRGYKSTRSDRGEHDQDDVELLTVLAAYPGVTAMIIFDGQFIIKRLLRPSNAQIVTLFAFI